MKKTDWFLVLFTVVGLNLFFFFPVSDFLPPNPKIIGSYVDEVSFIWMLHRLSDNFIHLKSIFDGNILYPYKESLLTSECVILQSFVYRLFYIFFQNKISAFNFTVMSLFSLNFMMAYWVFRKFFARFIALVGSVFFAYHMIKFSRIGHVHVICTILYPLCFYYLYQWYKTNEHKNLYLAFMVLGFQYYISLMSGLILMVGYFPFIGIDIISAKRKVSRLISYFKPIGLLFVILSPLVFSYVKMALEIWPNISPRNANPYGNSLSSFFSMPNENSGSGWFIGWVCSLLCIPGFYFFHRKSKKKEKWILYFSLIFIVLFSMGTKVKLYNIFYLTVPGVQFLRVPERVALVYLLGMSFIATLGLHFISSKIINKKYRVIFLGLVFILVVYENRSSFRRSGLPLYSNGYIETLNQTKKQSPVVFLPFEDTVLDALRMYNSLDYPHPIANGYTRFFPKSYFDIRQLSERKDYQKLKQYGFRYVIEDAIHTDKYKIIDLEGIKRY